MASRKEKKNRKSNVGDAIRTIRAQTVRAVLTSGEAVFYWFECSQDFDPRDGIIPADAEMHGPFKTEVEVKKDQRQVLLGPDCEVREGGQWDPAWDKLQ